MGTWQGGQGWEGKVSMGVAGEKNGDNAGEKHGARLLRGDPCSRLGLGAGGWRSAQNRR